MPKTTRTTQTIVEQVAALHASLATLEEQIAPLKAERDAHVRKHRAVYETERRYAVKIKALQEQVGPIWAQLKPLRDLMSGKAARS